MVSSVPAYYMSHIGNVLADSGVNVAKWLAHCDADKVILENENTWIPLEQYLNLVNHAVALSPDPGVGLKVGSKLGVASHGMLGFALLSCADLAEALEILKKYVVTRTPLLHTEVHHQDRKTWFVLKPTLVMGLAHRSFTETVVVSFVNLLATLSGDGSGIVERVTFDFESPLHVNQYADYLSVEFSFAQPQTSIIVDDSRLHEHFKNADEVTLKSLTSKIEAALQQSQSNNADSLTFRVIQVLEQERHQIPTLENVSRMLFMTPRTLHRHLISEGANYRQLLAETKCKQAKDYLQHTLMTVQQIAWAVGYEDVANFRRAFKSWTGQTPNQYRSK